MVSSGDGADEVGAEVLQAVKPGAANRMSAMMMRVVGCRFIMALSSFEIEKRLMARLVVNDSRLARLMGFAEERERISVRNVAGVSVVGSNEAVSDDG